MNVEFKKQNNQNKKLVADNKNLNNQLNNITAQNENIKKDNALLIKKFNDLEVKAVENNIVMNDVIQNNTTPSFANLFKINENKTVSQPMAEIINSVNNYNRQKKVEKIIL